MIRLILLILLIPFVAYGDIKIFFKIAVDERSYSSFLVEEMYEGHSTLHTLALRLKENHIQVDKIQKDFYNVKAEFGIKYNGRSATQYDFSPLLPDRFRHVVLVDEEWEQLLRREVYDNNGKLLYAYSFEDSRDSLKPMLETPKPSFFTGRDEFPGFKAVFKKVLDDGTIHVMYADGLNRFSVFISQTNADIKDSARILYGNYVYRKKIGNTLYTVVGTIPFAQMEKVVARFSFMEDD